MGFVNMQSDYRTIQVHLEQESCRIRIDRPDENNTINSLLIAEITSALDLCEDHAKIIILEGSPEVFCMGADFAELSRSGADRRERPQDPEPLYELWRRLGHGPYVSIAHVRGKVNAGGIGFVAACDLVISEQKAVFSLSELLFGLLPACVLPFLVRRIGFARANYMTLTSQSIGAQQALAWGLVDACEENTENLLRKHLLRLKRLSKPAISRYKRYAGSLDRNIMLAKPDAVRANVEAFSQPRNLEDIARYVETGRFPWEART
jgi:polyketide biosynthesis enoyl-CoA hydratase PksH